MSLTNVSGSFPYERNQSHKEPGVAASGDADGVMDIWLAERSVQMDTFFQVTITNNSSYKLPKGIAGTSFGYDKELKNGIFVKGTVLDAQGAPLSGTARIESDGSVLKEKKTTGSFLMSGPYRAGVVNGDSTTGNGYSFRYVPSIPAVDVFIPRINKGFELGPAQYGEVSGTVMDYNGEPVPNETVSAQSDSSITDGDGKYNFLAPGGVSVSLTALDGSYTKEFTPQPGQELVQNFRYSQLKVEILDSNYKPIPDSKITVNGNSYTTDENGSVTLPKIPTRSQEVVVDGYWSGEFNVDEMGEEIVASMSPDSVEFRNPDGETPNQLPIGSIDLEVEDSLSLDGVSDVNVRVERKEGIGPNGKIVAESSTNSNGVVKALVEGFGGFEDGSHTIHIGENDDRYVKENYFAVILDGRVEDASIELDQKTQTVDF